jgi:hypothetical protein
MRVFKSMLRWMSAVILVLSSLLTMAVPASADTGTYRISNYLVTLEPQSDGQVRITYEQQWQVLSGDIPWVTVGLPNSNFIVENFGGVAIKVTPASGLTGVRVDLDKDYQPGQTFNIKFTVMQNNLLERLTSDQKWRINFTPGWYDRAPIDHLKISLNSPVDYQTYSLVSPMPTLVNNNIINWERSGISPGGKLNIVVESTDGSFLTATAPASNSKSGGISLAFIITIVIILVVGGLIFLAIRQNRRARDAEVKKRVSSLEQEMAEDNKKKAEIEEGFEKYVEKKGIQADAEGRYYDRSYGNYITPAIWAAVIASQYGNRNNQPTGNVPPSCACACVSCACACACACAGGGAAGCSRKSLHECQDCDDLSQNVKK